MVPDAIHRISDWSIMRLVSIRTGDTREPRLGVETAEGVRDLSASLGRGATVATVAAMSASERTALQASVESLPLVAGATILAPIPRPARNIFCVGKNYH